VKHEAESLRRMKSVMCIEGGPVSNDHGILDRTLVICLIAYLGTSFLHFSHNAEFLGAYPNVPAWLTRSQVYAAWLAVTAIGGCGVLLIRFGYPALGLIVLAGYALTGFDGLAHYAVAPLSAHTAMMNFTIWFEVLSAAALLAVAVERTARILRQRDSTSA
jgi:hypothetical protein